MGKYLLLNDTLLNYNNSFFNIVNQYPNVALIRNNNSVIFGKYECYCKFTVTSENQTLLQTDISALNGQHIYLDGNILTRDDIHNIAQEKTFENVSSEYKLHYKDVYVSGRICYPFTTEDIGTQHILAFACPQYVTFSGYYDEISILNNFTNYLTNISSSSNIGNEFKIYMAKLENNEINSFSNIIRNRFNTVTADKWGWFGMPKNIKILPKYVLSNVPIDKCNLNDLLDLEKIENNNFNVSVSAYSTYNINLSNMTKLKEIEDSCFTNIIIDSLILPPNIEKIGGYTFHFCTFKDNCVIEIPESIKMMDYTFYECSGNFTLKFKSSIPPSLYNPNFSVAERSLSCWSPNKLNSNSNVTFMVPRGSKRAYFNAINDPANYDNYVADGYVDKLIEYDPE